MKTSSRPLQSNANRTALFDFYPPQVHQVKGSGRSGDFYLGESIVAAIKKRVALKRERDQIFE